MKKVYSIWFSQISLSGILKYSLYQHFGSCEAIFYAEAIDYKCLGIKEQHIEKLIISKNELSSVYKCIELCDKLSIKTISIEESLYPTLLRQLPDPPIVLFVLGNQQLLQQPSLSVVGARKCSEYGFQVAKRLSQELAERGLVIVSGMALGIDEAAHKGALESGNTIAILGTGTNVCYPAQNRELYKQLIEKGCVVSEYMPNTQPLPFHFPKRNRIISGLSIGTLVIEATKKSGSLITAELALEQNKEVFAVPGNINSKLSEGTNDLIKQGAKLIMETEDILQEMPRFIQDLLVPLSENTALAQKLLLDKLEIIVYDCLSWQASDAYTLENMTKLSTETMTIILLKLEMKGWIQRLPGNRYIKLK